MKLTIIPIDHQVYINGISYSPLFWNGTPNNIHALQWDTDNGWLEYNDGTTNSNIIELPEWANNAIDAWNFVNVPIPETPLTSEQNKAMASALLLETDWINQADVIDQSLTPHLLNQADFILYRSILRKIAVNPIDGNIEFPVKPKAQWSN